MVALEDTEPALEHLNHEMSQVLDHWEPLPELPDPIHLDHMFQKCFKVGICNGNRTKLHQLFELALNAVLRGILPIATLIRLKTRLRTLSHRCRDSGLWKNDTPLWWEPMPTGHVHEATWVDYGDPGLYLAMAKRAFASNGQPVSEWTPLRHLVPEAHRVRMFTEWRGLLSSGAGEVSGDPEFTKISGFEPQVIAEAPVIAAFAQWFQIHCLPPEQPREVLRLRLRPTPNGGAGEETTPQNRAGHEILLNSSEAHPPRPLSGDDVWDVFRACYPDRFNPRFEVTGADVVFGIANPPVPTGKVWFHEIHDMKRLEVASQDIQTAPCKAGIMSTVYREDELLDSWCAHHFDLGFNHILLIFDHLDESKETETANRLRQSWPAERLSIENGDRWLKDRWAFLPDHLINDQLLYFAETDSTSSLVAKQVLNANAALHLAQTGHHDVDWLLHLDADELFYMEGPARGGETVQQHFASAQAAGYRMLRYLNHEAAISQGKITRFKLNPLQAGNRPGLSDRLRSADQFADGQMPYFNAYANGKSAIHVGEGLRSSGPHSWKLKPECEGKAAMLAGPSILHYFIQSRASFRRKFLIRAGTTKETFVPGLALENKAIAVIRAAREEGKSEAEVLQVLDRLLDDIYLSDATLKVLQEAGLLFEPSLKYPLS